MNCYSCGSLIQPHFAFCEECGVSLKGVLTVSNEVEMRGFMRNECCSCGCAAFDEEARCEDCGKKKNLMDAVEIQVIGDEIAAASHRGRRHTDNQDSIGIIELRDGVAIAVADGVSSAYCSKEASTLAIQTAFQVLKSNEGQNLSECLLDAVGKAHQAICNLPYNDSYLSEPETTLVLAVVRGKDVWYAWVGDSRLYEYSLDTCKAILLTEDDSWLNEQIAKGVTFNEAEKKSYEHCITQCLGMRDDQPVIHVKSHPLTSNTLLLACSDGLWNYCDEQEAFEKMMQKMPLNASLIEQCKSMIEFANQCGGQDNISVSIYHAK